MDVSTLQDLLRDPTKKHIVDTVDALGLGSAEAQHLKAPLTSVALVLEQQHTLYIAHDTTVPWGVLKVGRKHLFYSKPRGGFIEMDPLCVLDFYVHPDRQRHGLGLHLFTSMLERESVAPHQLAYDRPSPKLFPFLRKHFKLDSYVPQSNRFVVYDAYFSA
ncbi:hypothetical protein H257_05167 [Aphanomyces astaci]|uniref:Alpha-tubulin N-acetyltransferase n=1 Tax=Aphanomyces astaci TaxID=112090 RepID=W4GS86_APHAT|nr:hypothetical protein H257_05167 [Aphanomyces astaci]ETV82570.1 hypothetical protein H257_05167 [Aphanomyces astaci]|eukprot:XP_009828239.1 hypothetical protein H257_05167 [Aphanomyces astaci]